MAAPDLSAIVLGYRAGASLDPLARRLHESLAASGHSFEIVLVANYHEGADDDTAGVAERLAQDLSVTRVVAHPKEGGMGWDLRSGLDAALGDVLVVIDGDGQYATGDVIVAFERLRETGSDIAKGRRASRGDGLYRRVVTTGFNLAFAILFPRRGVWDVNGKPKAIARSAVRAPPAHVRRLVPRRRARTRGTSTAHEGVRVPRRLLGGGPGVVREAGCDPRVRAAHAALPAHGSAVGVATRISPSASDGRNL